MIYFFTFDGATGTINGCGSAPDEHSMPAGALTCSQEQSQNPMQWAVRDGALVAADPPTAAQLLAQAQAGQSRLVSDACTAAITAGFTSSALGAAHTYPTQATDQTNLTGAVTASILAAAAPDWTINFWCGDADGSWAFVAHTAAQIQAVYADGIAALQALQARNLALQAQIAAATTVDAVQAVVWPPASPGPGTSQPA